MDALKQQNELIQKSIENYLEEIEKQKEINSQHQNQIETLLKFNERLLHIIEKQLNNNRKERDSLHPISERSERQSDLITPTIQSFIKYKKVGPQSQRGGMTNSLGKSGNLASKLDYYGRQVLKSQLNHSLSIDQTTEMKQQRSSHIKATTAMQKTVQASNEVKNEMAHEISELQKFKSQSNKFYDNKISEIRNLSSKLNKYRPIDHINQINQKLNISQNTAMLLKKIANKK